MKILLVDLEYDYGEVARGVNTIREQGYQAGMTAAGAQVETFFYDSYLDRRDELQQAVLRQAEESQPDFLFFVLFRDQFEIKTLDLLRTGCPTINWFGDDTWRFASFTKIYAPHFSHCITTDKYSLEKYHSIGVAQPILSQWAAIESVAEPSFDNYEFEVSFVGGANPFRKWFVKELAKVGVSVSCFGHGWPQGAVSSSRMYEIFRRSKINLNLSNSVSFDLRYLLNSPLHIAHSLKSKKLAGQIKARNFEIPFAGGFQLTDYTPSLEDYFQVGLEVACYSSLEDAALQIQYFLHNESEREDLRQRGFQRARGEHGYSHRFKKIFEEIGE